MNPRDVFILSYQFKSYYNTEFEWRNDFDRFKSALREYDKDRKVVLVFLEEF